MPQAHLRVAMVIAGWEAMPINPREPHTPRTVASRMHNRPAEGNSHEAVLMLGVLLLVAGIPAASALSRRQTVGAAKAQDHGESMRSGLSEVTVPPCNAVISAAI